MVLDVFNNKYEYILKEGIIPDWSSDSEGIYYLKFQEPNNRASNDSVTGMYYLSIEDDSYPKLIASENDLKTLLGVSQNQKISGIIDQSNDLSSKNQDRLANFVGNILGKKLKLYIQKETNIIISK